MLKGVFYIDGMKYTVENRRPDIGEDIIVIKVDGVSIEPTVTRVVDTQEDIAFDISPKIGSSYDLYYDNADYDVYYVVTSVSKSEEVEEPIGEVAQEDDPNMVEQTDVVNSPPHYNFGSIEVIDFIDQVTDGYSGRQAYLAGNIIKYVSRAPHKNGVEDTKKAAWYLERLINEMSAKEDE